MEWGYGVRMTTHYKNPQHNPLIPAHAGTLTLPAHCFIDTAPLVSRYVVLAQAVLSFTAAGRLGRAMRASHKIVRLVRTLTKLEGHNVQLKRKLDMLSHKPWRERVLRELGGMRKLRLWEAAKDRIAARAAAPVKPVLPQEPAWLYTPARRAESERLKARKREVFRAGHNPLIVRDRCRVDFEGEFRLAPLPRGERTARQVKVYTEETIIDYDWNPMPYQQETGFGPACVWPQEFYAAMEIEAEVLEGRDKDDSHPVIPDLGLSQSERPLEPVPNPEYSSLLLGPGSHCLLQSKIQKVRDDKKTVSDDTEREERCSYTVLTPLPLKAVLSPKTYRDLF